MPFRRSVLCGVAAFVLIAAGSAASRETSPATSGAAGAWTTWGNGPARSGYASTSVSHVTRQFALPLRGRITGQILAARGSYYAATSAGEVVSFSAAGYVRWSVDLGQGSSPCSQLDGYGVTGTGVIDVARGALFVADAFGRLHALGLATGAELPGWPVSVFADSDKQLVWGALTLVGNSVYVPTASYCDAPSLGGVYRVDAATRAVTGWTSVPPALGGGGGVWGWGGMAYSTHENALFVVTANAFAGGSNTGSAFSEAAGYGEHLVELSPSLAVTAASHPSDLAQPLDLDFVGSPVVVDRPGCGELVFGADKNDELYAWRAGAVSSGPVWSIQLQPFSAGDPLLSQLAWSPSLSSLYAVTGTQFVRIGIGADCKATALWKIPLGTKTENGSPTVAGNTVWFAVNKTKGTTLNGYSATTGKLQQTLPLGGLTLTAPTVAGGELLIGTFTGLVEALDAGGVKPPAARSETATELSKLDGKHEWESRSNGVYATDDGGKSWRRIYPQPANAVLRLSVSAGLIDVPTAPARCMCATRKLWTADGGRTWHQTTAVGDAFTGAAKNVYWWAGRTLHALSSFPGPATRSRDVLNVANGTVVDASVVPGGVAALVSNRVNGLGWDTNPRVSVIRGGRVQTVTLPARTGEILAQSLVVAWPRLTVRGTDFAPTPAKAVSWVSADGGASWATG